MDEQLRALYAEPAQHGQAGAQVQAALECARAIGYQHVLLDGLVPAATVLVATGDAEGATPLLAHALTQPASRADTTARAQPLLTAGEERLTPPIFAAAVAHGRATTLETLVDELLALPEVLGSAAS